MSNRKLPDKPWYKNHSTIRRWPPSGCSKGSWYLAVERYALTLGLLPLVVDKGSLSAEESIILHTSLVRKRLFVDFGYKFTKYSAILRHLQDVLHLVQFIRLPSIALSYQSLVDDYRRYVVRRPQKPRIYNGSLIKDEDLFLQADKFILFVHEWQEEHNLAMARLEDERFSKFISTWLQPL